MSTFFEAVRGGFSIYLGPDANNVPSVRFCLARFGEDADQVLKVFWKEVRKVILRLFRCSPTEPRPRLELCTQARSPLPCKP